MSGCPNGCSRPYVAEIALTGRAPGKYNLWLGGGFQGERLNRLAAENIGEERILEILSDNAPPLCARTATGRTLRRFHHANGIPRLTRLGFAGSSDPYMTNRIALAWWWRWSPAIDAARPANG